MRYPQTPDGRYFVVKGRLWRCSNPALPEPLRQQHVNELMRARRDVKQAMANDDALALRQARARVDVAKVALGERGAPWWNDGSPDYNRHDVMRTPYAPWYQSLSAPADGE